MASKDLDVKRSESKKPSTGPLESGESKAKKPEKTITQPAPSDDFTVDRQWLAGKSQEELMELIFQLFLEVKSRMDRQTSQLTATDAPTLPADATPAEVKIFTRMPARSTKTPKEVADTTWRLILSGLRTDHKDKPIGIEVFGDVILGRSMAVESRVDVDLTNYDAINLGVSRRHALLRPEQDRLVLIDLGSTNGTLCNAIKLRPGRPHELADGDTISLAGLHFKLQIVKKPIGAQ